MLAVCPQKVRKIGKIFLYRCNFHKLRTAVLFLLLSCLVLSSAGLLGASAGLAHGRLLLCLSTLINPVALPTSITQFSELSNLNRTSSESPSYRIIVCLSAAAVHTLKSCPHTLSHTLSLVKALHKGPRVSGFDQLEGKLRNRLTGQR